MHLSRALALVHIATFTLMSVCAAQTFTSLAYFTDGTTAVSSLIQGRDGNFYGTSNNGGNGGYGEVFKITTTGTLTTLYNFCSQPDCDDGDYPFSALTLGVDGNFYGTTQNGGTSGMGVVFKITPDGTYSVIHNFQGLDGNAPEAGLVLATDGNFYGTTFAGGSYAVCVDGCGTVFKITPTGTLTTLHTFATSSGGMWPFAPLVQGTDGNLYGTTYAGGDYPKNYACQYGCGTVFKTSTSGTFTTLHKFDYSDGAVIYTGVAQGADGALYGTAWGGGYTYYEHCGGGCGTLYKVTSAGKFTLLDVLDWNGSLYAGPIPANNGNLYGQTYDGGISFAGVIYKLTPAGGYTTLFDFTSAYGGGGTSAIVQGTDGKFYGPYYNYESGIYSFDDGLSPFVAFVVPGGKRGMTAQILGQGLTGTTAVSFNGVAASSFSVASDTYMTAVVPTSATTGPVVVTTPSGSLTSNVSFRISQ